MSRIRRICGSGKTTTGVEARPLARLYAALKEPLFHGCTRSRDSRASHSATIQVVLAPLKNCHGPIPLGGWTAKAAVPTWFILELRQDDSLLGLVLAFTVGVTGFADFVGLEENDLAKAFVGVNAGRKRRGV